MSEKIFMPEVTASPEKDSIDTKEQVAEQEPAEKFKKALETFANRIEKGEFRTTESGWSAKSMTDGNLEAFGIKPEEYSAFIEYAEQTFNRKLIDSPIKPSDTRYDKLQLLPIDEMHEVSVYSKDGIIKSIEMGRTDRNVTNKYYDDYLRENYGIAFNEPKN